MKKKSTEREWESSSTWEDLEAFARQGVQRLLQRVLEEEVDSALGGSGMNDGRPWMRPAGTATVTATASRGG